MKKIEVSNVSRIISYTSIPIGQYKGVWSGYHLKWRIGNDEYQADTNQGIRGTADCTVICDGKSVQIEKS